MAELGSELVRLEFLRSTLAVLGASPEEAKEKPRNAERIMTSRRFVTITESLKAVEVWLSSLAGHAYANVRHSMVSTLNLSHIAPLSTVWQTGSTNLPSRSCCARRRQINRPAIGRLLAPRIGLTLVAVVATRTQPPGRFQDACRRLKLVTSSAGGLQGGPPRPRQRPARSRLHP